MSKNKEKKWVIKRWLSNIIIKDARVSLDGHNKVQFTGSLSIPALGVDIPLHIGGGAVAKKLDLTMAHSTNKDIENES